MTKTIETENRKKVIVKISSMGIFVNIALAIVKIILGGLSGSMSIISDAMNNIADSSSSLITIIGTKLAQKPPNKEHPFGYGRIEYLTSLIIGVVVLITGLETMLNSVQELWHPKNFSYSIWTLVILAITVFVKIILGTYTQNAGKKLESGALVASGADAKIDAIVSAVTILSALVFIIWHISIDAYASLFISAFIIKAGIEVLKETINKILGERPDEHIIEKIYSEIQLESEILGVHDLILNNYGPGKFIGSINVEVAYDHNVGELYPLLHKLQTHKK